MRSTKLPICIIAILISTNANSKEYSNDYISIQQLKNQMKLYVEELVSQKFDDQQDFSVHLGHLDRRLKLKRCANQIQYNTVSNFINQGRLTVSASCNSPKAWRVRVPVTIERRENIVITSKTINRHETITPEDLSYAKHNILSLHQGYFTSKDQLENMVAKRTIKAGAVLSPGNIKQQVLVKRGQTVQIIYQQPGLTVSSQGVALKDGVLGENIRIKNTASKRIISATVQDAGTVAVNL